MKRHKCWPVHSAQALVSQVFFYCFNAYRGTGHSFKTHDFPVWYFANDHLLPMINVHSVTRNLELSPGLPVCEANGWTGRTLSLVLKHWNATWSSLIKISGFRMLDRCHSTCIHHTYMQFVWQPLFELREMKAPWASMLNNSDDNCLGNPRLLCSLYMLDLLNSISNLLLFKCSCTNVYQNWKFHDARDRDLV